MKFNKKYAINILSGTQETFEALSHFLYNLEVTLKEYKNNEQLIEYLISKNVTIANKEQALKNIEKPAVTANENIKFIIKSLIVI